MHLRSLNFLPKRRKNQPFGRTLRLWNTQRASGNSRYVTMLRDPVDRVLSAYHYSKSFDRSDAFRVIQENNMDVVEFAEQYGGSWLINGQTKILAGAEPQTSLSDEELYLNALNNIENHFLYVGLLESFDRSLIHLQKVLNWSTPYYTIRTKRVKSHQ